MMPTETLPLLSILHITPSAQSVDYVRNKGQFHLHTLLTEQSHPATRELSRVIREDTQAGIEMLLSVDHDISERIEDIAADTTIPDRAVAAVCRAIHEGRRIYVYGCGATGRLAKQMESAFWRPFWAKARESAVWPKLAAVLPANIDDLLIGEMTGGDRALVSSLEGFEDLQVIGRLQLADHGIRCGDVVFCVTEGGETSSVIGTILAALAQYEDPRVASVETIGEPGKTATATTTAATGTAATAAIGAAASSAIGAATSAAIGTAASAAIGAAPSAAIGLSATVTTQAESRSNLFYLYNNPDELLMPFDRSRSVLENEGITKLNLTTGPQAITGSTRMQATTIETFVLGCILEHAITHLLSKILNPGELSALDLNVEFTLSSRLQSFRLLPRAIRDSARQLARLTDLEAETYESGRTTFCFANRAMTTVFTDCTERSPTFRLAPFDPVTEEVPKSWIRVWTGADDGAAAWRSFLGRDFRGLDRNFYKPAFDSITDPYLRESALKSLDSAGSDQRDLYDFSLSGFNRNKRGPGKGDLCIVVCLDKEVLELIQPGSGFHRFLELAKASGAKTAILLVQGHSRLSGGKLPKADLPVVIKFPELPDPLGLRMQVALKMMMNAHSTAVMARLGRVTGNSMTAVNPGNLKLIGRATHLIRELVNRALEEAPAETGSGPAPAVTYAEANAVLFDCIENRGTQAIHHAEVALCIIRILETVRAGKFVDWKAADAMLKKGGLDEYLNPKTKK